MEQLLKKEETNICCVWFLCTVSQRPGQLGQLGQPEPGGRSTMQVCHMGGPLRSWSCPLAPGWVHMASCRPGRGLPGSTLSTPPAALELRLQPCFVFQKGDPGCVRPCPGTP